jgi:prolyl-tRNA synthetase
LAQAAEQLYEQLQESSFELYFDDRDASAGVKFKDADLIGIPWRVAIGQRNLDEGVVEVKRRASGDRQNVPLEQLIGFLRRTSPLKKAHAKAQASARAGGRKETRENNL